MEKWQISTLMKGIFFHSTEGLLEELGLHNTAIVQATPL